MTAADSSTTPSAVTPGAMTPGAMTPGAKTPGTETRCTQPKAAAQTAHKNDLNYCPDTDQEYAATSAVKVSSKRNPRMAVAKQV